MPIRRTSNRSSYDSGFYNPEVYSEIGSRVVGFDSDALIYINAVEAEDGESLESGVKSAYNAFIVGCKADGIWSAIQSSYILAGARTLSGALTPLAGIRPTGVGFGSGDYYRITGLQGSGGGRRLETGRNNNADGQNNAHMAVYVTLLGQSADETLAGGGDTSFVGSRYFIRQTTTSTFNTNCMSASNVSRSASFGGSGLYGVARQNSSQMEQLTGNLASRSIFSSSSSAPRSGQLRVFTTPFGGVCNSRLSFYSAGNYLNLDLLDARVTTLMNSISGALS
jgi:hypothetical protein